MANTKVILLEVRKNHTISMDPEGPATMDKTAVTGEITVVFSISPSDEFIPLCPFVESGS